MLAGQASKTLHISHPLASLHRAGLLANWELAGRQLPLRPIEPLE
jgi:hypothetical protein